MAALLSSLDPTMPESTNRAPSIRSVASSSSVGSAVSLSRRPRTRTRSRTVTGASSRPEPIPPTPTSELPYLDKPVVQEPEPDSFLDISGSSNTPPTRPSRSLQRPADAGLCSSATPSTLGSELANAEATFVESLPFPTADKMPKASPKLGSNLPVIQTGYKPAPSAFSRDPSLIPNVRDSVSTHQSNTSSSVYPPSNSTLSGPESPPSPRSMSEQLDHLVAIPISNAEVQEVQEFDGDDVAYRLQLLVKNNYFLPPAHSKPSPSDFATLAANAAKKQPKPSTPAFLDLFRGVKPKSKPTTPTASPHVDAPAPMLRTTSDSITTGHALRPQQPRPSFQTPRMSPQPPTSRGRVVVVREKMLDIAVAAKQAEQDLKNKGVRLNPNSQQGKQATFDDVIDPTDAVDVPLPSASYPFAVQASALHGLGVQDSLGAALLADRLPPPKSPNMSSSYDAEEDWRKALLHEAVHHSLDNTPDVSTFSHILGASTPLGTPRVRSASRAQSAKLAIKSLDHALMDLAEGTSNSRSPRSSRERSTPNNPPSTSAVPPPAKHASFDTSESRTSSYLPARVDTPVQPLTPLAPPPRKHYVNPLQCHSQSDLTTTVQGTEPPRSHSSASHHTLRKARSSPMLSDRESVRRGFVMTPPPIPSPLSYGRVISQATTLSFDTVRDHPEDTSESHYTDDDYEDDIPRSSMTFSAVMGRPSLSEYSQSSMSPTTSVFQDALNHRPYYSSSASSHQLPRRRSREEIRHFSNERPLTRNSTMSPPPRMSSSLAHIALPPPPRSANYPYQRQFFRPPSIASSMETESRGMDDDNIDEILQFHEPEPTTPPYSGGRGHPTNLSLDIPPHSLPAGIHSAPGSSSPPSFFDSIQTQPNAMDDLESSSDESDDDDAEHHSPPPQAQLFIDPRTRALSTVSAPARSPLMKLGNHSTPYVGRPTEPFRQTLLPIGGAVGTSHSAMKKPIGHVPAKAPFFTDRKSDSGHPSAAYDFYRYAQQTSPTSPTFAGVVRAASSGSRHPPMSPTSPSAQGGGERLQVLRVPSPSSRRNNQRAQESLRKLDGMLLQHMETEKDTIKRIATTMKQSPTDATIP